MASGPRRKSRRWWARSRLVNGATVDDASVVHKDVEAAQRSSVPATAASADDLQGSHIYSWRCSGQLHCGISNPTDVGSGQRRLDASPQSKRTGLKSSHPEELRLSISSPLRPPQNRHVSDMPGRPLLFIVTRLRLLNSRPSCRRPIACQRSIGI